MPALITRRSVLVGSMLVGSALAMQADRATAAVGDATIARIAELERGNGGRLGVSIVDLGTGRKVGYRADERFAMCSTFKLLATALVLSRVDRNEERLDRRVAIAAQDLVAHSPVTQGRVGPEGISVGELCEAAMTRSAVSYTHLTLPTKRIV